MTEEQGQAWESMVDRAGKKRPGDTMAANPRVVLAGSAEMERLRRVNEVLLEACRVFTAWMDDAEPFRSISDIEEGIREAIALAEGRGAGAVTGRQLGRGHLFTGPEPRCRDCGATVEEGRHRDCVPEESK